MDMPELELPPHLAQLNPAQRAAATYGIPASAPDGACGPLLIIAGAGTGKTRTLTHRVAHLVLNGADPRRILLMTFARRMAAEMTRRVEHICAQAYSDRGSAPAGAIAWSGTFHAMGARLLRLHAEAVGLPPSFSILDRGDAEDLIDMVRDAVRQRLGFAGARAGDDQQRPTGVRRRAPGDAVGGRHSLRGVEFREIRRQFALECVHGPPV